jgi:hypothetical protein
VSDRWAGVAGWGGVGLLLLATAVLRRRDGRRGWALLDGALAALTGLLLLLVPGPWQLVPTALWVGLAAAVLTLGVDAARRPGQPDPVRRWRTASSPAISAAGLALGLWTP